MPDDTFDRLRTALADRYDVESQIGRGGMATVFRARDLKHDRLVAIKVLHPELAATVGADRFLREIRIAAKLHHPHILMLIDSGEADGLLYYVMPLAEGETLRERLNREKQLPLDDALQIAREVADALSYAHDHGVIHRDVKPENIMLESGHAVVTDFGIARAISEAGGDRLTETGIAVDTPSYMSPEQAAGSSDLDQRSDVYSLACVVYEMLAGEPPFTGPTAEVVLRKHVTAEPPSLAANRPDLPTMLVDALRPGLAKVPADRYGTAVQLTTALAKPARSRVGLWKGTAIALAGTLALAVGISLVFDFGGTSVRRIERLAVLPLTNLTGEPDQEYLVEGMHGALIATLSQIDALAVISRTSVMRYKDTDKSVPEIAQELAVDAILEGSVLPATDSVRIQLQLVAAAPERRVWGKTFDADLRNVLALQNDVVRSIADEIQVTLTPEEQLGLTTASPVNPNVQEAVLRGEYHLNRLTVESLQRATAYFTQAIGIDSSYAPAFLGLAESYQLRGAWWGDLTPVEALPLARTAVEEALRLDSTLAEAYSVLGTLRFQFYWDWEGAEAAFRRSLRLNPGGAWAHTFYANFLRARGRVREALSHSERSVDLDPLVAMHLSELSITYSELGEHERAAEVIGQALELDPGSPIALWVLGIQHAGAGRFQEAIEVLERAADLPGVTAGTGALGVLYVMTGQEAKAREILRQLEQLPRPNHFAMAAIHAALGNEAEAIGWLERGNRERQAMVVWLGKIDSDFCVTLHPFRRLRSNPRFQDLLRRMDIT